MVAEPVVNAKNEWIPLLFDLDLPSHLNLNAIIPVTKRCPQDLLPIPTTTFGEFLVPTLSLSISIQSMNPSYNCPLAFNFNRYLYFVQEIVSSLVTSITLYIH